jgi:hypothetical protein
MKRILSIALASLPLMAETSPATAVSKKTGASANWIVEVMSLWGKFMESPCVPRSSHENKKTILSGVRQGEAAMPMRHRAF